MRKGLVLLLAIALVVAFSAPAMADLKVTGFYRAKAMLTNFYSPSATATTLVQHKNDQSAAYVEQRMRIKFDMGTEVARAILHLESDMNWGMNAEPGPGGTNPVPGSGGARNSGGALSADEVQLETKEAYVWFRIPDTSFTSTVGMQMVSDHYAGIFANNARMASIFVNAELEPTKIKLGWAKLFENQTRQSDDVTMYLASAQFAPSKDTNVGVNFYWLKDDNGRVGGAASGLANSANVGAYADRYVDVYMPGVNFSMNAGPAKISGFGFYQFGRASEVANGVESFSIRAFALDLRADLKAGPGNFFVEGFYISGDHTYKRPPSNRSNYRSPVTLGDYTNGLANANSGFTRTRMYFLFGFENQNVNQCVIGCSTSALGQSYGNQGNGLWHVAGGYSQKFTDKLKGEFNLGYASAVGRRGGAAGYSRRGIGLEANVRADYNISKGLDFSLIGSYLNAGNFLTRYGWAGTDANERPERNYYMLASRLNFSF